MSLLNATQIVAELDRYIVGQTRSQARGWRSRCATLAPAEPAAELRDEWRRRTSFS